MSLPIRSGLAALVVCLCLTGSARALNMKDLEGLSDVAGGGAKNPSIPAASWVLEGPIDPDQYILGPGDHVGLYAYNLERTREDHVVDSDGRLELPGLGRVQVARRTLSELRRDTARRLATAFRCDSVDLWISLPRTIRVQISGATETPTWMELGYQTRLSATLQRKVEEQKLPDPEATMPTAMRSPKKELELSWRNVLLLRDGDTLSVDLLRRLRTGDASADPMLESGDRVVWSLRDAVLTVGGPFRQGEGEVEFRPGDTPRSIVELQGGPRQGLSGARYEVVRAVPGEPVSRWSFTAADPLFATLSLRAHDRLYLRVDNDRDSVEEVQVEGEVRRPGAYALDAGTTMLSDVLALAEPDSARADLAHIRVIREARHDPETRYMAEVLRTGWLNRFEHDYLKSRLLHDGGRISLTYDSRYFDPAHIPVLDGDRIQVLRKTADVEVLGAVNEPGTLKLQPGWSVGDYIKAAGGKLRGARNSELRLRRAGSDQFVPIGLGVDVAAGDVIMLMYRDEMTAWEKFKEGLAVTAQVMTVVLVVRGI